ncbi:FMN-linked oxidoreductase [Saitoella complicata NRRL Y-17804]|nr:FMN-linked oxidoreductase [Saitoella complicata NRRL Y-17804]ODQ49890.1 FMN-linked oxidoreductase [Saitoella complicata NRRL Y-17804]
MTTINKAAPNTPYYTPAQEPPAGTFLPTPGKPCPTLFKPLKIKNTTFNNRFWVSPMCQYSADDGHMTDYHLVHLGAIAMRGPGFTMIEATAVTPEGRITPQDVGLWKDEQIAGVKKVADFVKSQGQVVGMQIAHAGRKGSTLAPWLGTAVAPEGEGQGFAKDVIAPSAEAWDENHATPKEMSLDDIEKIKQAFVVTAKRAIKAGVQVIEIHGAHGYLLHEFVSPATNHRTDQYGGSFDNRIRLSLEICEAVKAAIPAETPLFYRVSATDWLEPGKGWDLDQSIELAKRLHSIGIDLLDVSSGGNHCAQQINAHPGFQVPFATAIKKAVPGLLVGAVGLIVTSEMARDVVEKEEADVVFVAREFLRDPSFVLRCAHELGVEVKWPNQYHRAQFH